VFVTAIVATILLLVAPGPAAGAGFLPPAGKIFAGTTGKPVSAYVAAVGKHPPVYQEFVAWGQWIPGITQDALDAHARMMMAIGTMYGSTEAITPGAIARGEGDAWLIALQNAIYASHNVTYIRLMGEMNGYWNAYCAYNADGSSRGADHSTAAYKQAWKRVTLIMRGGSVPAIDASLRRLGMPSLRTPSAFLPQPDVAMLWVPEADPGNPAIPANAVARYYPGDRWVDWTGTDFYSSFPNFAGITALYDEFPGKPFMFGEYALWNSGDDAAFIDQLWGWVSRHPRVRMLMYNQYEDPFRLIHYPNAARELRRLLAGARFPALAPEWSSGTLAPLW
jgi:hypothetical protein